MTDAVQMQCVVIGAIGLFLAYYISCGVREHYQIETNGQLVTYEENTGEFGLVSLGKIYERADALRERLLNAMPPSVSDTYSSGPLDVPSGRRLPELVLHTPLHVQLAGMLHTSVIIPSMHLRLTPEMVSACMQPPVMYPQRSGSGSNWGPQVLPGPDHTQSHQDHVGYYVRDRRRPHSDFFMYPWRSFDTIASGSFYVILTYHGDFVRRNSTANHKLEDLPVVRTLSIPPGTTITQLMGPNAKHRISSGHGMGHYWALRHSSIRVYWP